MLAATLLALGAAVFHAGWNLAVKQSSIDRYLALWGQFTVAGAICLPIVIATGGLPAGAWWWVAVSGAAHLPYCWYLARAYDSGDFSLVYPVARGGGAVLAAAGGAILLDDHLPGWSIVAIVIVATGLCLLAGRGDRDDVRRALIVAAAIGVYSTADARGIRVADTPRYALASMLGTAGSTTAFGLATGRRAQMGEALRRHWRRFAAVGGAATVTYGMVQVAFQRAPVGYVTALRESSVVLAAFLGWRRLGEQAGARRVVASLIVVAGLIVLVAGR